MGRNTITDFDVCLVKNLLNGLDKINTIETGNDEDDDGSTILYSKCTSPEESLIKKDAYEKLSNEAKHIINTIINCSSEDLCVFLTPKYKQPSKRRMIAILEKTYYSKVVAMNLMEEIGQWVKTLKG